MTDRDMYRKGVPATCDALPVGLDEIDLIQQIGKLNDAEGLLRPKLHQMYWLACQGEVVNEMMISLADRLLQEVKEMVGQADKLRESLWPSER